METNFMGEFQEAGDSLIRFIIRISLNQITGSIPDDVIAHFKEMQM